MVHVLPETLPAAPRVRWADLRTRAISAAVLVPLALACLWVGGSWWTALVGLAALGLGIEWVQLSGGRLTRVSGLAVPLSVLVAGAAVVEGHPPIALSLIGICFLLVWWYGRRQGLAAGVPYLGLATAALLWLRADPEVGRVNLLFLLCVVWASDIGAYVAGRLIGGPKLAPSISPGKTWSGAVGGLIAALAIGGGVALLAGGGGLVHVLAAAAMVGIAAQLGDLLESGIKRHYGVKDSGRLIPGHGGLLDRLDGLIIAAPVAALLVMSLGRGVVLWQ
ncbi:Phosphatidate cytidylyltransferase [Rhodovastum atsumiense]|nr:Phosphatidate cytidylyltransferase [Rhodovastum atsumiense]